MLTKGEAGITAIKEKISSYPKEVVDLVLQTLSVDHEKRPSSQDLCLALSDIRNDQ